MGSRRARDFQLIQIVGHVQSTPLNSESDTPVFVLHLYDRALLNGAALRAVGYTKDTPPPPAGEIQRDRHGNPTGLLIAKPNAMILYATLAKGPKLSREDQLT